MGFGKPILQFRQLFPGTGVPGYIKKPRKQFRGHFIIKEKLSVNNYIRCNPGHGFLIVISPKDILMEILDDPILEENIAFFNWSVFCM